MFTRGWGLMASCVKELARIAARGELDSIFVFMSSATDPYQGAERQWRLSRACLDVFTDYPPGLLILQTRSPMVKDDFDRIAGLGERCWLNFTLETDLDEVRRTVTPRCPSIGQRTTLLRTRWTPASTSRSPSAPVCPIRTSKRLASCC